MAQNAGQEHRNQVNSRVQLSRLGTHDSNLAVTLLQAARQSAPGDGQKLRSSRDFLDVSLLVSSAVPLCKT